MIIFSNAMHVLGLLGAPRRTPLGDAPYVPAEWNRLRGGLGGAILWSRRCSTSVWAKTVLVRSGRPADMPTMPVAETLRHPQLTPEWLDSFKPWLIAAGVLLLIAYGPQIVDQIGGMQLTSPGMRVW